MTKVSSVVDGARIRATRELKGFKTQESLARVVGVPQPHICDLENGKLRNPAAFVRVADALECTTDFLFRRGPYASLQSDEQLRAAVSQMAFDAFASKSEATRERHEWCRRTLHHRAAPVTVEGWVNLSEQIELAIGPKQIGPRLIEQKRRR